MRWLDELRREVEGTKSVTVSVSGSVSTTYSIQNLPAGLAATTYAQSDEARAATTYDTQPVEVVNTEYT